MVSSNEVDGVNGVTAEAARKLDGLCGKVIAMCAAGNKKKATLALQAGLAIKGHMFCIHQNELPNVNILSRYVSAIGRFEGVLEYCGSHFGGL